MGMGMSDKKIKKSDLTRQHILDAAAGLFLEKGFAATTLRQIADRARMKAGSIYYHFDSKDDILDAVLDSGIRSIMERVQAALAELPADASHRDRVKMAVQTHLGQVLQKNDYTLAFIRTFGQVPKEARDRTRTVRRVYTEFWIGLLEQAQAAGEIAADIDVRMARLFLVGGMNWTVQWFDPDVQSIEEITDQYIEIWFTGVAPR